MAVYLKKKKTGVLEDVFRHPGTISENESDFSSVSIFRFPLFCFADSRPTGVLEGGLDRHCI
jgi:hypothetical protein